MTVDTLNKLISIYQQSEKTIKILDLQVNRLAMKQKANTYNQCVKICETINRKQELINLCRIFEEETAATVSGRRKQTFMLYLQNNTVAEIMKELNISSRTFYRNINEYKSRLANQFALDGYTDKTIKEMIQKTVF